MKIPLDIENEQAALAISSFLFRTAVQGVLYSIVVHDNTMARAKFKKYIEENPGIKLTDMWIFQADPLGTIKVIDVVEREREGDKIHITVLFGVKMGNFVNRMLSRSAFDMGFTSDDLELIDEKLEGNIITAFKDYINKNYGIKLRQERSETGFVEDIFYSEVCVLKDSNGCITLDNKHNTNIINKRNEEKLAEKIKIREGSEEDRIVKFFVRKEMEEIEKSEPIT